MNTTAVVLVLISAVMHAVRNFLTKTAFDKQVFVWWYELVGLLFFAPVFVYGLWRGAFVLEGIWPIAVLSGLLHFLYWLWLSRSLDEGDLSRVYPISRSAPALVFVIAVVFMGEDVSVSGAVGILLAALGVYTISLSRLTPAALLQPLRNFRNDKATRYAFLTLLAVAAYSIVDKQAVMRFHPVAFAFVYPWVSMALLSGYIRTAKRAGALRREWQANRRAILVCGVLGIFGYFLILMAFSLERISYVVGLRQISIVFSVLLGVVVLKERHGRQRMLSAVMIFIGVYLIARAG
ncbi:MAG: EamA family transporter [Desulfobacteraceae bacterium]|nr:EamA family transporter [Desulfobacteraceae bacterium]MBC2752140.1 EamA family transporter [Desulfobacteraceae bacterium]